MNVGDSISYISSVFTDTGYTYCTDKKEVITFTGQKGIQIDFYIDYSKEMCDDEKVIRFQQNVGPVAYTLTIHDSPMLLKWAKINGIIYGDTTTSVNDIDVLKIEVFSLSQNYPNPFNSFTKINFYIPKKSSVTLKIYDLLGREIETLIDKYLSAGEHNVSWNAKNLSSGIYLYQLKTSDIVETKKLIFQK
jgi:hypothetical protein